MSADKLKYPKRAAFNARQIARQVAIAKARHYTIQNPLNYFRKQHATDCGNSRCALCGNVRHVHGQVTMAEKRVADQLAYALKWEVPCLFENIEEV